eukprot:SAG31_NODE_6639_length_1943_cov_1.320499_1_plen_165_part_00
MCWCHTYVSFQVVEWPDGRWLICPRDPPDDTVPWGPKLLDSADGSLTPLPGLSKGLADAHSAVQWSFLQVVRTATGALIAMGGRAAIYDETNGKPSRYIKDGKPTKTTVLFCQSGAPKCAGCWTEVQNFPAGMVSSTNLFRCSGSILSFPCECVDCSKWGGKPG